MQGKEYLSVESDTEMQRYAGATEPVLQTARSGFSEFYQSRQWQESECSWQRALHLAGSGNFPELQLLTLKLEEV